LLPVSVPRQYAESDIKHLFADSLFFRELDPQDYIFYVPVPVSETSIIHCFLFFLRPDPHQLINFFYTCAIAGINCPGYAIYHTGTGTRHV
jgi:hypothetical protein